MTTFIRKEDFWQPFHSLNTLTVREFIIDLNANLMQEQMIERITDHKNLTISNAGGKMNK